jgi:hypothetical protein
MGISGRVLFEPRIDEERADFKIKKLLSGGVGPLGGNPFSESDDMGLWDGRTRAPKEAKRESDERDLPQRNARRFAQTTNRGYDA